MEIINWEKMELIKPETEKSIYEHERKESVRNSILTFLNEKSKCLILESPDCIMIKKMLDNGIKDIVIPNHEEYGNFPEEFKEYVYPFSLGSFLGNAELKSFDFVWADFCGTWNTNREQLIPLFERELLNNNSLLVITNSLWDIGKNDYVKDVLSYLYDISEYSGYVLRVMEQSCFSGNGMYSVFIKIDYATKLRCPKCHTIRVIKRGTRSTKYEVKQTYYCKSCEWKFTINGNRLRVPEVIRKFIFNKLKEGKYTTRELSQMVNESFNTKISNVSISKMLRDSRRYFGRDVKKKKKTRKTKVKPYKRKTKKGYTQYPEYTTKKEILSIE